MPAELYKPGAVVSSRLAPRVAASCLLLPGLRAGICCAVLPCMYVLSLYSVRLSSWINKGDYYYYYY